MNEKNHHRKPPQIIPENQEKIRLRNVAPLINYTKPDLNRIIAYFITFAKQIEYIILKKTHIHTHENKFKAVKASKRGNDVYANRVKNRFDRLIELPGYKNYEYKNRSQNHQTNIIYATLTLSREKPLAEAWYGIGVLFNRYKSALTRKYGKINVIRVWEAHKDGYPHIHAIFIFEEKWFTAFWHRGRKKHCWRIKEYRDLKKYWKYGHSDIKSVDSFRGGVFYLKKYLSKTIVNVDALMNDYTLEDYTEKQKENAITTMAMLWIFRKRSFSISRDTFDLIRELHNSNTEDKKQLIQTDLEGNMVYSWSLVGFFSGKIIQNRVILWSVQLTNKQLSKMKKTDAFQEIGH